ncbi:hypothetical protein QBC37DRAFT_166030 [Rhypophila decipiens]|uniref:Uncharacterized protein n=1 Tax=Rhypophila decipiens TaxID=261697 RepID=A0AAN6YI49_9PEZI|nr:hypothetical protein QBC37DRAFT_166030 [Rhypophila decipiens]
MVPFFFLPRGQAGQEFFLHFSFLPQDHKKGPSGNYPRKWEGPGRSSRILLFFFFFFAFLFSPWVGWNGWRFLFRGRLGGFSLLVHSQVSELTWFEVNMTIHPFRIPRTYLPTRYLVAVLLCTKEIFVYNASLASIDRVRLVQVKGAVYEDKAFAAQARACHLLGEERGVKGRLVGLTENSLVYMICWYLPKNLLDSHQVTDLLGRQTVQCMKPLLK